MARHFPHPRESRRPSSTQRPLHPVFCASLVVYLLRYYRNAHGALLVYDIASKESFEGAKSWLSELRKFGKPDVVILLVGNKLDLGKRWWRLPLSTGPHCFLKVAPNARPLGHPQRVL
jgi:hypothetical protein